MEMEWYWALAILIGMVMFFMAMGVPVALTFITANVIGVLIFMGDVAGWTQIVDNSTDLITRFTLGPVPMFIMMGALFFHTGLAIRVFDGHRTQGKARDQVGGIVDDMYSHSAEEREGV